MMKLWGVLLVIGAGTLLGLTIAGGYGRRVKQLENLRSGLRLLETEILYGLTPLPEAFARLATVMPMPTAGLFGRANEGLAEKMPVQAAWQRAVAELTMTTALSKSDLEALGYFGYGLGEADGSEQQKKFRLLEEQMERAVEEAIEERNKNQRVWQCLGITGGIAVALLLI